MNHEIYESLTLKPSMVLYKHKNPLDQMTIAYTMLTWNSCIINYDVYN